MFIQKDKIVKEIKITLPRKDAILEIKKDFPQMDLAKAREFLDFLSDGGLVGLKKFDDDRIMQLMVFGTHWCEVVLETEPYTKSELELLEKVEKAEKWLETLSKEERAHYELLLEIKTPKFGGAVG